MIKEGMFLLACQKCDLTITLYTHKITEVCDEIVLVESYSLVRELKTNLKRHGLEGLRGVSG